jgi:hypothetical protein
MTEMKHGCPVTHMNIDVVLLLRKPESESFYDEMKITDKCKFSKAWLRNLDTA